jgi:hypothetical protein
MDPQSHISLGSLEVILPPPDEKRITINANFFYFVDALSDVQKRHDYFYPIINRGVTDGEIRELDRYLEKVANPETINTLTLYYAGEIEGFEDRMAPQLYFFPFFLFFFSSLF